MVNVTDLDPPQMGRTKFALTTDLFLSPGELAVFWPKSHGGEIPDTPLQEKQKHAQAKNKGNPPFQGLPYFETNHASSLSYPP